MSMRPASCKRRITSSISVVVNPNLAASPPDFSQRPEPFEYSLTRIPIIGRCVQDEQAFRRLVERERGVQFRLRSGLKAEIVARAFAQVFFDDCALLVDLHRIDAHVRALVFVFADGLAESALKFSHLARNELGKAQKDGRGDAATLKVIYDLLQVRRVFIVLRWMNDEIAFSVDIKVTGSPVFYAVGFQRLFNNRGQ